MKCRHCASLLNLSLLDLGSAPPSNAYLSSHSLKAPEKWFPLRVLVCEQCWLVQAEDYAQAHELFDAEYAYFSGYSRSWLEHAERYVGRMVERFALGRNSHVLEVAANDGYLLQYVQARQIPCTGIEPTAGPAAAARDKSITIVEDFFGVRLASNLAAQGRHADLIVANNVLAHVPDINDFVAGFATLLKPQGVATFEFPHLPRLIAEAQFDTVYHEHFSYLSLVCVERVFRANGLVVFDVETCETHGGSLRVFAQRSDTGTAERSPAVDGVIEDETKAGVATANYYVGFQAKADRVKNAFLEFLLSAKRQGKTVAGYGAAAKGNTLLNYAGVKRDLMPFVVDRNPVKQGKYLPGSRIPVVSEERIRMSKPDFIVILPWNLRSEVMAQLDYIRDWNGQFVTAIPVLEIAS